ncbi:MAG: endonuclease V [Desulfomonile tiedjei]|nr:endonuclease V [Desulfomonile tiedjei]
MIAATDVYYQNDSAVGAAVLFSRWDAPTVNREVRSTLAPIAAYQPGYFYKRELPCILDLLRRIDDTLEAIVIDGFVWLDAMNRPGLGAHLYRCLDDRTPVIGVAKNPFKGALHAAEVYRGRSQKPLYVTAAGMDQVAAAENIRRMHGSHRIPTLLKRVDRLCRSGALV